MFFPTLLRGLVSKPTPFVFKITPLLSLINPLANCEGGNKKFLPNIKLKNRDPRPQTVSLLLLNFDLNAPPNLTFFLLFLKNFFFILDKLLRKNLVGPKNNPNLVLLLRTNPRLYLNFTVKAFLNVIFFFVPGIFQ